MDGQVFRQGQSVDITIPAGGKIAVFTNGKATISQIGGPTLAKLTEAIVIGTATNGVPYLSAAFTNATPVRVNNLVEAPVYYQYGVGLAAPPVALDGLYQGTPGTLNATGALTTALIQGRIVTSTTGAAVAATLDTGTVTDATGVYAIGDSWDWTVINTGGNAFTVTAAAGHTIVGVAAVATVTSATFRTAKTAANTFVTYRLAG